MLRRILTVLLVLLLAGAAFVGWRGYLRGERVFFVEDDSGWYVECIYQRIGGKERTYSGGWYSEQLARAEGRCPFIRR